MKKNIMTLSIATLLSTQAFAFDISIGPIRIKGDDPQIIKDVTEGAKHLGGQISNGVRDTIAAVGNATGITNIIDSNRDTFSKIGSGYACIVTLCYSEKIKKDQLEEAEREAKASCDAKVAEATKNYAKMGSEDRIQELKEQMELYKKQISIINQQKTLVANRLNVLNATTSAIATQMKWRQSMAEHGVSTPPPLADQLMRNPTDKFEITFAQNQQQALDQVNADIDALSNASKRTRADLMADFLYMLRTESLVKLTEIIAAEKASTNQELATLDLKYTEAQTGLASASAYYAQETQNK
ncbi:hypothetical protein DOM22_16395 [Bdellovibrio sp. ZAP7]|uniref:hypothetical protein n=1 Tax=Bdellovibrio sp. ZAP7 TaxID=2231053 RepID=UPI00115B3C3B|nr:hypothetical protein [Bdellovibrio sp. ZAP7]QDK46621.1 hypothetical protein DOM22_16395 [Bdellovibrio sp. ZAP7]